MSLVNKATSYLRNRHLCTFQRSKKGLLSSPRERLVRLRRLNWTDCPSRQQWMCPQKYLCPLKIQKRTKINTFSSQLSLRKKADTISLYYIYNEFEKCGAEPIKVKHRELDQRCYFVAFTRLRYGVVVLMVVVGGGKNSSNGRAQRKLTLLIKGFVDTKRSNLFKK